jgi:hypothetical protein
VTGQSNRTPSGQAQPATGNRTSGRRGLRDWLAETPGADTAPTTPEAAAVTESGRPRKAERRKARQRAFFAARRAQATTPIGRVEVAVDQLRAVGTERDLMDAALALEQIAGRRL